jgi:hypothetical protein
MIALSASPSQPQHARLSAQLARLRGDRTVSPDASVVIPVNAQGDLTNVLQILHDLTAYVGSHRLEIVLVVNNYACEAPPAEISLYRDMGVEVVSIPNVRRPGEAIGFSARIPGIRAAKSSYAILFDADCRIPNATALIDWYVKQFRAGANAAYTYVGYYDLPNLVVNHLHTLTHHGARWFKRAVLRIPTTRGSNYAVERSMMLGLYEQGLLADEMNVGPVFKAHRGRVVYSGNRRLKVLTSGRMWTGGWVRLFRYLIYRTRYNLRVLPVRADVAQRTGRENDPVRRFVENRQVL